jgi:predicted O-methyltransferase YrrM
LKLKQLAKILVNKSPILRRIYTKIRPPKETARNSFSNNSFLKFAPPGHYYSPIPDIDYIQKNCKRIFSRDQTSCPAINLATERQIELVKRLAPYYNQMPFSSEKREKYRYDFNNEAFGHGSAIILYCIMRHFQPKRILEVGSGFSSAAMLDVNDHFFDGAIKFTFVEPYPKPLFSLLKEKDKESIIILNDIVQNLSRKPFTELENNDILFIDSSHVAKTGSDVLYLLTEILPILNKGVIVHIHDIYWPFEYPMDWLLLGRAWNEAYFLKAFLQFNNSFDILLFNSYLATHHQKLMKEFFPLFLPNSGSSLWLRKND